MDAGMTGVLLPTSSGSDLPEVTTRADRRVTSDPLGRLSRDDSCMVEHPDLAARELFRCDRDRDVRSLSTDARAIRGVEPASTDLVERVGSALRGGAGIAFPRLRFGVEDRVQRGEQRLSGLRIEVAVDTDHPAQVTDAWKLRCSR
jgi:hypothetical protein